jgi:hypothetical protein
MLEQTVSRSLYDINNCFSKVILDSNINIAPNLTSWSNYEKGIYKGIVYAALYQKLLDKRQYTFLLEDNSFFQFFFEWNGNELIKARLAFYPTPVKISGALENLLESAELSGVDLIEEMYFGAEAWFERGIDIVNTSSLRVDYDSSVTSHVKCHIQLESINELRITSKHLLNPFIFFTWIISHLNLKDYDAILAGHSYVTAFNYHKTRHCEIQDIKDVLPYLSAI